MAPFCKSFTDLMLKPAVWPNFFSFKNKNLIKILIEIIFLGRITHPWDDHVRRAGIKVAAFEIHF